MPTFDDQFADASDESVEGFLPTTSSEPPSPSPGLTTASAPSSGKKTVDSIQLDPIVQVQRATRKNPGLLNDSGTPITAKRKWPDDRKSTLGSVKRKKSDNPQLAGSSNDSPTGIELKSEKNNIFETEKSFVNCIATHQVQMASRLVSQMLRHWPEVSPGMHIQAAVVIENFGRQVFLPYIAAYHHRHGDNAKNKAIDHDRIFYATMLAFREVLAQNAETFFIIPKYGSNSIAPDKNEEAFTKVLMATTIILHACEAAGKNSQLLLDLIEKDNFPTAKKFGELISPNGILKKKEEEIAWKIGFNLALSQQTERNEIIPPPTACWVSIIENLPERVIEEKVSERKT